MRGDCCQACGALLEDVGKRAAYSDRFSLELHHRYYLEGNRAWDYPDPAFWLLCPKCHDCLHTEPSLHWDLTLEEFQESLARRP